MSKTYSAGIATAYGAAKQGGYQGSYTDFCNDIAQLGDITAELGSISATATTLSNGRAKAILSIELETALALTIPISSPLILNNPPPELPPLIAVSILITLKSKV